MLRLVIEAIALSPQDVPRRATRVKVELKSGAVSEREVARPGRRDVRRPLPDVLQRIRQLAAVGALARFGYVEVHRDLGVFEIRCLLRSNAS